LRRSHGFRRRAFRRNMIAMIASWSGNARRPSWSGRASRRRTLSQEPQMTRRPPAFASLAAAMTLLVGASMVSEALAQKRPPRSRTQGETIGRIFPGQMAALLRDRGNPAEVITENNRTRIRTEIGTRRSSIYFYACNDDGCQSIQYRTLFRRHERFTLAFVN